MNKKLAIRLNLLHDALDMVAMSMVAVGKEETIKAIRNEQVRGNDPGGADPHDDFGAFLNILIRVIEHSEVSELDPKDIH